MEKKTIKLEDRHFEFLLNELNSMCEKRDDIEGYPFSMESIMETYETGPVFMKNFAARICLHETLFVMMVILPTMKRENVWHRTYSAYFVT